MPDPTVTIPALPELIAGNINLSDLLYVVKASGSDRDKKATIAALRDALILLLEDGSISSAKVSGLATALNGLNVSVSSLNTAVSGKQSANFKLDEIAALTNPSQQMGLFLLPSGDIVADHRTSRLLYTNSVPETITGVTTETVFSNSFTITPSMVFPDSILLFDVNASYTGSTAKTLRLKVGSTQLTATAPSTQLSSKFQKRLVFRSLTSQISNPSNQIVDGTYPISTLLTSIDFSVNQQVTASIQLTTASESATLEHLSISII